MIKICSYTLSHTALQFSLHMDRWLYMCETEIPIYLLKSERAAVNIGTYMGVHKCIYIYTYIRLLCMKHKI